MRFAVFKLWRWLASCFNSQDSPMPLSYSLVLQGSTLFEQCEFSFVLKGRSRLVFAGRNIVDLEKAVLAQRLVLQKELSVFRPGLVIPVSDLPLASLLNILALCDKIISDLERPALLRPV